MPSSNIIMNVSIPECKTWGECLLKVCKFILTACNIGAPIGGALVAMGLMERNEMPGMAATRDGCIRYGKLFGKSF